MSDWIEVNLPFVHYETFKPPKHPNIDKKARKHFGKSPDDDYTYLDKLNHYNKYNNYREELYHQGHPYAKIEQMIKESSDPDIQKMVAYLEFREEYDLWCITHPDLNKWKIKCDKALIKHTNEVAKKSFVGRGLNKPGVLIEVEDNGKLVQYLIGHINTDGGKGLSKFLESDSIIVKRYKVVWEE